MDDIEYSPPPAEIPFQQVIQALLDEATPFPPRYLYRLSDLGKDDIALLKENWQTVPAWRRQALMEDVEQLRLNDTLLSFEELARLAIQDREAKVRLPAVHTLYEFDHPSLVPIFLTLLEKDPDAEVRAGAATALGQFVYAGEMEEIPEQTLKKIEDCLISVTQGQDEPLVRRRALESLGYSSRKEAPRLIEKAYQTGYNDWVATALFAMGRSANERWEAHVLECLENDFPPVRLEAVRAAGELEIKKAVPLLLQLLDDPDENVHLASIWSLSQTGGEGVRDRLEHMYDESQDDEESDLLEDALDNLTFNEDLELMPLIDLTDEDEDDDLDETDEDLLDQDDLEEI